MARGWACLLLLHGAPALALTEQTPWGPFNFPPPVRSEREAQAMFDEAKVPIVVAIRFLAATDSTSAPWVTRHLACGTNGSVRKDLAQAMVRASTVLAYRLAADLDHHKQLAANQRAGLPVSRPVRYAGPIAIVLEPIRISLAGEPLPPPVAVEPHLRVFVTASVPRCSDEATGAFGRLGELPGGFMITASPALELGWPTAAPNTLGQRIVMATENALTDGFCCGQEANFSLDSLVSVYDFRDYQTKAKLRATLRTLATAKQRDARWIGKVRDAFGLPERYPASSVQSLHYGEGRIASGEFTLWPVKGAAKDEAAPAPLATLADIVMGLAWYAHTRADLVSPAILETYDPERKYSFVGWPEEFRESSQPLGQTGPDATGESSPGKVLEVFGTERKFSFVGEAESLAENIAFAFAAWKAEAELGERLATRPFIALFGADDGTGRAFRALTRMEADALASRRVQAYKKDLETSAGEAAPSSAYATALRILDDKLRLPGFATLNPASGNAVATTGTRVTLRWADKSVPLLAGHAEELHAGLRRLYRDTFRERLDSSEASP
jgi:hypothetical protein